MIIEIAGLPGAGKSTWARQLVKKCSSFSLVSVDTKQELIYLNLRYCVKHPMRSLYLFILIVKNSPTWKHFYMKFMNNFLHVNAKYEKAQSVQDAVIDQGYVQNTISIFEQPVGLNTLQLYLRRMVPPEHLIVFDIEKQVRRENLIHRGYGVREGFSEKDRERWLDAIEENFLTLKTVLKETYPHHLSFITSKEEAHHMIKNLCKKK